MKEDVPATAPPEPLVGSLPPVGPSAPVVQPARARRRLGEWLPPTLVVVLAFLAGSFPARNSDLWFHLGAGRLLAEGRFSPGEDPFAYTTSDRYWAAHSWLFDLVVYHLYQLMGGTGLVVLKALLVGALAGLMLLVRRRDGGAGGVVACCTVLGVLAMSPRLQLQPACVSYFLLGLTFWLLWRGEEKDEGGRMKDEKGNRLSSSFILHPSSFILLTFVVWINVDEWFLIGPLLVALFWLGERLGGERRTPGWLAPAGLAVCLLNPHTWHAFTLPAELSPVTWSSGLRQDERFGALFASPWQSAYRSAALDLNAAVLAYFALTFLGLLSFLLERQALRGWRLVVWLAFALLAAWQARAIPFFAVVAAPITSLNVQDFLAQRRRAGAPSRAARFASLCGGVLLSLGLLALIFLPWPGWLAGRGRAERPVGWGVQAEPSLQRVAETLHDWRSRGLIAPDERIFSLSPEVARYSAWFSPGEKHFFDHRYPLFGGPARDYLEVCQALEGPPASRSGRKADADWREVLRRHKVAIVVLYDRAPGRLFAALHRLAGDPNEWTLLNVAGQAVIFGWNEARPPGGFKSLAFDPDRLAFGPADARSRGELPAAPDQGPDRLKPPADFQARLRRRASPPTWESSAATLYLHYFHDSEARQQQRRLARSLGVCAASLAGLPAQGAGATLVALQLFSSRHLLLPTDGSSTFLVRDQLGPFFRHLVDRPPALPLLAVRAARRAVAADAPDSNAWLRLGQAYLLLRNATCERSAEGLLPPLAQLRFIQAVTALEQAVGLDPDLEAAHHELGYLYGESNALDMALEHRRAELRISRRAGVRRGETAEEWAHRLELLERDAARIEETIKGSRDKYDAASRSLQGKRVEQARVALQLGLARQAADDVLLPYPADLLGPPGIKLELEVLLSLGRADEVRAILSEEAMVGSKHVLPYYDIAAPRTPGGAPLYVLPYSLRSYEWLQTLAAAALGDYAEARLSLRALRAALQAGSERLKQQRQLERGGWQLVVGLFSSPSPLPLLFSAQALGLSLQRKAALAATERDLGAQQADLCVLEGLLALEQGATDDARSAFLQAQRLGASTPFAAAPIVGGYLPRLLTAMRRPGEGPGSPGR
jgi:tetratricopeptide (TPR) repeat protein